MSKTEGDRIHELCSLIVVEQDRKSSKIWSKSWTAFCLLMTNAFRKGNRKFPKAT